MIMMHILTHLSCPWSIFATVCRQIVHSSDLRESIGAIMKKIIMVERTEILHSILTSSLVAGTLIFEFFMDL